MSSFFHYRNLDVSSLKILAERWAPDIAGGFTKSSEHRALQDIRDSIAELAWYRDHLLGCVGADGPGIVRIEAEELAHTVRNGRPILEVLRQEFANATRVLEIGSGNGQHAVVFADALPNLTWQTSDLAINHDSIRHWLSRAGSDNILPPLALDTACDDVGDRTFDAAFSANTVHIMGWPAVEGVFRVLGDALEPGGRFCLYGPFRQNGAFNTDSNAAF